MEKEKLYIPKGAADRTYWFKGFGYIEFKEAGILIILGLFISALIYIFGGGTFFVGVFIVVHISSIVLFYSKNDSFLSVSDFVKFIISFYKLKKFYPYVYLDDKRKFEDWLNED